METALSLVAHGCNELEIQTDIDPSHVTYNINIFYYYYYIIIYFEAVYLFNVIQAAKEDARLARGSQVPVGFSTRFAWCLLPPLTGWPRLDVEMGGKHVMIGLVGLP